VGSIPTVSSFCHFDGLDVLKRVWSISFFWDGIEVGNFYFLDSIQMGVISGGVYFCAFEKTVVGGCVDLMLVLGDFKVEGWVTIRGFVYVLPCLCVFIDVHLFCKNKLRTRCLNRIC
jgi:hypothetical protein